MAMASSSSTTRLVYGNYDWNNNITCNLSNCSTPTSSCLSDSCLNFQFPSPPPPLVYNNSRNNKSDKFLPNFIITAAALLAFLFFLLLIFYSILRRRRLRGAHHDDRDGINPLHHHDSGVIDDDGEAGTHHVWLIRTVGLDDPVIRAIPAVIYRAGDGAVGGGKDCTVCLGEFTDGEVIKLLPKCNHVFHPNCIDTWLKSHVNCPLCRAPIVLETTQLESNQQNQEECAIGIGSTSGSSSSSSNGLQRIRRSVSLDCLSMRPELDLEILENTKNRRGKTDEVMKKRTVEVKRSLSSRSGRLFFSRYKRGHGRSTSVLPL